MKTTLVLAAALSAGIAFAQQGGQDGNAGHFADDPLPRIRGHETEDQEDDGDDAKILTDESTYLFHFS